MAMSRASWIIINDWNLFFKKLDDELPFEFCLAKVDIVVYYIDIFEASFHEKEEEKKKKNEQWSRANKDYIVFVNRNIGHATSDVKYNLCENRS